MALTKTKKEQKEAAISKLYNNSKNLELLVRNIDNLLDVDKYAKISGMIFVSKIDLINTFPSKKYENFERTFEKIGDNITRLYLKTQKKNEEIIEGKSLLITRGFLPNVYILLTHEKSDFLNKGIIPYFLKYHPLIARSYIDTPYIHNILESYESGVKRGKVRILRYSSKSWVNSENARKKVASEVKWTDIPFKDLFGEVSQKNEWLKSVDFTISSEEKNSDKGSYKEEIGTFKIYRDGRFQCNHDFSLFFDRIIESIANKAFSNLQLFDMREKTRENNYLPKPLVIEYNIDIFKDKKENIRLIDNLKKISYSSLSVYHGNPYLHASYVDYLDGSSYDIWVLSNDRITIVPQMSSTPAALEKLVDAIFTGFREGLIKDFRG